MKTNHFICNESGLHMKHNTDEMRLAFNFTFWIKSERFFEPLLPRAYLAGIFKGFLRGILISRFV